MFKRTLLLIPFFFFSITTFAMQGNDEASVKQIEAVVESFRTSYINKDRETFKSLFYRDDIPFIAVFSDEMLEQKRKVKPDYPATVNFGQFGNASDMISDDKAQEEKIWDLQVHTDGHLGSAHFQYSDHVDGEKRAWGTESWSLVKVGPDWKITSISYTVTETEEFK